MVAMLATSADMRCLAGVSGPPVPLQKASSVRNGSRVFAARVSGNDARVQRIASGSCCCSSSSSPFPSGGVTQQRRKVSRKGGSVRSALSAGVDDGAAERKYVKLTLRRLATTGSGDGDQSSLGRYSSTAISGLPEQQQGRHVLDNESAGGGGGEIARPQPVMQSFADSPFVGEFAMELTAAVQNGLVGAVGSGLVGAAVGTGLADLDTFAAALPVYQPKWIWYATSAEHENSIIDKAVNATIVGSAAVLAITKMLTIDHDYWHGWTLLEIIQYAPKHNWFAYEELLRTHPIFAKMMISGTVYSIGDWIAQCVEGRPALEFNRLRVLRSGIVGFCLHGSMSHFYYHFCEWLFPFQGWWVLPLKVGFDQTIWSGFWNSVYFTTLGLLRLESPVSIAKELREKFFPLLKAGWKLWPFAHLITYGVVPVEQRLLWVDMVEILWVTILAMFANEKAEARIAKEEEVVGLVDSAAHCVSVDEVMSSEP